ncbi:hypothetical protein L1987_79582 [Smallanthus sonchifolius]|uniref:Uncharacterized protein n=1 Tax=Smallanthus sonchifolius TaxID=185202 RepID=A0ACB8YKU4_9ASTR|nr:hypothetical protein L1987_79582 [Smallanthus sonchifolius]
MPKKTDPSPSALLPRRSTRGAAKLTNPSEGVASVTLGEPPVGPIDLQERLTSALQPPILSPITDVCDIDKEYSGIPSVSVSSTASDQVLGSFPRDGSEKTSSAVAGNRVARKTGPAKNLVLAGNTAGRSDLGSSGSPGVPSLNTGGGSNSNSGNNSCSMNEYGGLTYAGASSFPLPPVSGEAAVAPSHVVSVSHASDVRVHGPAGVIEHMHGVQDEQGSKLNPGNAVEMGCMRHASS